MHTSRMVTSAQRMEHLINLPAHVLKLKDKSELFSLKQFIAPIIASKQTYTNICENHNKTFPKMPMLS